MNTKDLEIWKIVVGPLKTNTYILVNRLSRALIIDPGPTSFQRIIYMLDRNYITGIEYIILTHGHFDHITDAQSIKEVTKAKIVMHVNDFELLDYSKHMAYKYGVLFRYPEVDYFISSNHRIQFGNEYIELLWTPGHTKGSIAIALHKHRILFTGDTLLPKGMIYIDPINGSIDDYIASLDYLTRIAKGYIVYPGHGEKKSLKELIELARNQIKLFV